MTNEDSKRTRTITWEDPRPLAEAGRSLPGLEFLQKIVSGELPPPPLAALLNFDIVDESGKLYAHGTTTCLVLRP
jgi:hypothetical protein